MQRNRLKWQCRRGMRELDVLLSGWLEEKYDAVSDDDKSAFRRLLSLPDPEIARYLLAGERAGDPDIARVVERIRGVSEG
ncbi:MAG: succinate dehydrogenase assembly factor 2 [Gammaproteobacteria bacterium]|nr:succinate dehydrogenase assembly factor 2 [Gammaproteobacteria bacterium]